MRFSIIVLLSFLACSCAQKAKKPVNVIWLLVEDLSPDLGYNGNQLVKTPNIDALANAGVSYTNTFATGAVCTPSRTAFATGMYQTAIDAHQMRYPEHLKNELPAKVIPLNELMRRQGYQTANIKAKGYGTGKTDWSFKSDKSHFDFSKWEEIDANKPFFAVVNFKQTHRGFSQDKVNPVNPDDVKVPVYYPDVAPVRQDWSDYYETIQSLDKLVGKALADIKKRGLDKNTVICFFSDHGRPMTRAKMFNYDSGLKVPMIIKCPENHELNSVFKPKTEDGQLISLIDLTATTLQLAGGDVPEWMQGQSFIDPKVKQREAVFSASDIIGGSMLKTRSVRTSKFRYNRNFNHNISVNGAATAYRKANHPIYHALELVNEAGRLTKEQKQLLEPLPEEELYDVENDPYEVHNLAKDEKYKAIMHDMRSRLESWQKETTDYGMQSDSEELLKAFENYRNKSAAQYQKRSNALRKKVQKQLQQ
ncbi:hypothetical protein EMN47_11345 [Prolixibacteraceae bacterium JC049]|nr:hypothetical protein [Prolixibacteraceae bacterium JC049]